MKYKILYTYNSQPKQQEFFGLWEARVFTEAVIKLGAINVVIIKVMEQEIDINDFLEGGE